MIKQEVASEEATGPVLAVGSGEEGEAAPGGARVTTPTK